MVAVLEIYQNFKILESIFDFDCQLIVIAQLEVYFKTMPNIALKQKRNPENSWMVSISYSRGHINQQITYSYLRT